MLQIEQAQAPRLDVVAWRAACPLHELPADVCPVDDVIAHLVRCHRVRFGTRDGCLVIDATLGMITTWIDVPVRRERAAFADRMVAWWLTRPLRVGTLEDALFVARMDVDELTRDERRDLAALAVASTRTGVPVTVDDVARGVRPHLRHRDPERPGGHVVLHVQAYSKHEHAPHHAWRRGAIPHACGGA